MKIPNVIIRWGKEVGQNALDLVRKTTKDQSFFLASGIAFDIVLCAIPLSLLLVSVMTLFLESSSDSLHALVLYLGNFLPYGNEAAERFLKELVATRKTISWLGVGGILWTSMSLSGSLRIVLEIIFEWPDRRAFWRGKMVDLSIVGFLFLLFLGSIIVTAMVSLILKSDIERVFGMTEAELSQGVLVMSYVVSVVLSIGMFYGAYRYLPDGKVDSLSTLVGAALAGGMWEIAKQLFDLLFFRFTATERIYGSYSILVALALWTYLSGWLFIVGAEVAFIFAKQKKRHLVIRIGTEIPSK